jgi:hypothetical protein
MRAAIERHVDVSKKQFEELQKANGRDEQRAWAEKQGPNTLWFFDYLEAEKEKGLVDMKFDRNDVAPPGTIEDKFAELRHMIEAPTLTDPSLL